MAAEIRENFLDTLCRRRQKEGDRLRLLSCAAVLRRWPEAWCVAFFPPPAVPPVETPVEPYTDDDDDQPLWGARLPGQTDDVQPVYPRRTRRAWGSGEEVNAAITRGNTVVSSGPLGLPKKTAKEETEEEARANMERVLKDEAWRRILATRMLPGQVKPVPDIDGDLTLLDYEAQDAEIARVSQQYELVLTNCYLAELQNHKAVLAQLAAAKEEPLLKAAIFDYLKGRVFVLDKVFTTLVEKDIATDIAKVEETIRRDVTHGFGSQYDEVRAKLKKSGQPDVEACDGIVGMIQLGTAVDFGKFALDVGLSLPVLSQVFAIGKVCLSGGLLHLTRKKLGRTQDIADLLRKSAVSALAVGCVTQLLREKLTRQTLSLCGSIVDTCVGLGDPTGIASTATGVAVAAAKLLYKLRVIYHTRLKMQVVNEALADETGAKFHMGLFADFPLLGCYILPPPPQTESLLAAAKRRLSKKLGLKPGAVIPLEVLNLDTSNYLGLSFQYDNKAATQELAEATLGTLTPVMIEERLGPFHELCSLAKARRLAAPALLLTKKGKVPSDMGRGTRVIAKLF